MKTAIVEPDEIPLIKRSSTIGGLSFYVEFDEDRVKPEDLCEMIKLAGTTIDIGDWRPKYGRFNVI